MAHISTILDDDNESQVTMYVLLRFVNGSCLPPSLSCFSRLGYHASPSHLPASAHHQHVPLIMLRNVKSFVSGLSLFCGLPLFRGAGANPSLGFPSPPVSRDLSLFCVSPLVPLSESDFESDGWN